MGDDPTRLAAAHNAFAKLGFISSHLTLFPMPNYPDVRAHLLAQDVIWVGGGSTANLLALWRLHGLDAILRECWEAGVVLKGVSAGSLCWHVGGTTDSFGPTCSRSPTGSPSSPTPTARTTTPRSSAGPLIHRLIADGTLPDGYATENGTGLVFFGTELQDAFTEVEGKAAYALTSDGGVDPRDAARDPAALTAAASERGGSQAAVPAQSEPACTVSVSRPERRTVPGTAPVNAPSRTISVPLTRTWRMPLASA